MTRPITHLGIAAATGILALGLTGLAAAPANADGIQQVSEWAGPSGIVDAFQNGGTVQLADDIDDPTSTHTSLAVGAGKSVTLDLNGHDLTIDNANPDDAGIAVTKSSAGPASLTIEDTRPGTNRLTVTGGSNPDAYIDTGAAGIGGNSFAHHDGTDAAGTITIKSGTIIATGGAYSAGIGGGDTGSTTTTTGATTTITGGTVTATGGNFGGAGIGGSIDGNGRSTTITGGTITATGTYGGAGIGGGADGNGGSTTITGGSVHATGGNYEDNGGAGIGGAGIGGGYGGDGGDVAIGKGATVTATGGTSEASAVGPGQDATGTGTFTNAGHLTLLEGSVLRIPADAHVRNTKTGVIDNHGTIAGGDSGGGVLRNHGTLINEEGATVSDNGDGVGDHFEVTDHNFTLTYDPGVLSGSVTTPPDVHVYAPTPAAGHVNLPDPPQDGYAWTTTYIPAPTAIGPHTDLDTLVGPRETYYLTATKVTNPQVTAHLHPTKPRKPHHGWYRSHRVRVTFTCTDGSAHVTDCPAARTFKSNGVHRLTRTIHATDSGTATVHVIVRIDHKRPTLKVRGVKRHHTYRHQPKIRCHATDTHSGIKRAGKHHKTCTIKRHKIRKHGHTTTWRYKVTARDLAGNKKVKKGTYNIRR